MKHSVLVALVVAVAVNLCHGYAIKEPGAYTASFSKSSSSASAYSHSSSSSYTFGGDLSPTAVEGIHDALKAGAVAHASAGAVAGSEATAGAVATASASAHAGAAAPSAVAASGAVAGSSVEGDVKSGNAATDSNAISESGVDDGSYKKIASDKYTTNYSSGDQTNYAVSGEYVQPQQNSVGGCTTCKGPFPGPNGSIHDYKLAPAGQSGATSGATAHQQQSGATIHGSNTYSGNKVSSGQYSTSGHVSPSLIATLPGSSGSIYDSKPAGAGASASAVAGASASSGTQSYQVPTVPSPCSGSGCGSTYQATPGLANIIPVLPGPSGSIYDSKPASAGHSSVGESSSTTYNSGSTHVQSIQPVPAVTESQPHYAGGSSSTSYNSGSTNVESSQPSVIVPLVPVVTESQPNYVTSKPIFPGPSGSIYSYKPAPTESNLVNRVGVSSSTSSASSSSVINTGGSSSTSYNSGSTNVASSQPSVIFPLVPVVTESQPNYVSGSSSTSYNSGSTNIQSVQPEVVPVVTESQPNYVTSEPIFPGPTGSINSYEPAPTLATDLIGITSSVGSSSSSSTSASNTADSSSTSYNSVLTNVQSLQPVVVPVVKPIFPGPTGSINSYKPAPTLPTDLIGITSSGGSSSSSSTSASNTADSSSTSYNSGLTNVQLLQPVVVPVVKPIFPGPTGSINSYKPAPTSPTDLTGTSNSGFSSSSSETTVLNTSGSSSSYNSGSTLQPVPVPIVPETQSNYVTAKPIFPGPIGSIHSFKPAPSSSSSSATTVLNTSGSSTSYNSGSTVQPVAVPETQPNYAVTAKPIFPGPTGSIYSYKPAPTSSTGTHLVSTANSGVSPSSTFNAYSGAGSITNNPHTSQSSSKGSIDNNAPHSSVGGCLACKGPFPGPAGSIHSSKPVSAVSYGVANAGITHHVTGSSSTSALDAYSGAGSVTNIPASHPAAGPACSYSPGSGQKCGSSASQTNQVNTESGSSTSNQYESAYSGAGSVTNIPASHPVVGPACSYAPGSGQNCGSSGITHTNVDSGATSSSQQESGTSVLVPSVHPEIPQPGTYYINKPSQPSKEVEAPFANSPSFSGQIPCSDSNCGESQKIPAPSSGSAGCGSGTSCGGSAVSSGSFSSAHSSDNSAVVYNTKDTTGQHSGINHDQAHLSGGLVFQNDDGSYSHNPVVTKPNYKNSDKGGYAVSTNQDDNTGVLLGPGTGHLPIEAGHSKPFGTQGALGGSVQFSKGADNQYGTQDASGGATTGVTIDKEGAFGTQGAFGGSSSFSSAASQSSAHTTTNTGQGTTQFSVEKLRGTEVTPVQPKYPEKSSCLSGACGSDNNAFPSRPSYPNTGIPIKLPCYGKSCGGGNTQVYIVEEKEGPSYPQYGNGYNHLHRYYGGSGVNGGSGYATGQVLINQGPHIYDYTNHNTGFKGSNYAGSYGGHYPSPIYPSPHPMGYFYGCKSGRCGGQGLHSLPLGLFNVQKFGGGAVSGAYSNSGSGGGASAGSFASATAGASASASAGSYF